MKEMEFLDWLMNQFHHRFCFLVSLGLLLDPHKDNNVTVFMVLPSGYFCTPRVLLPTRLQRQYHGTSHTDRPLISVNLSSGSTRWHSVTQYTSLPRCRSCEGCQLVTSVWYSWVSIFLYCSKVYCLDFPSPCARRRTIVVPDLYV